MDSLIKNSTVDYKQIMEWANEHIRLDDERIALKEEWHTGQSSERKFEKRCCHTCLPPYRGKCDKEKLTEFILKYI